MFSAAKTAGPGGYIINNSLRFRSSASAYLSRTPASAGNRKTWTYSTWFKMGAIPSAATDALFVCRGAATNTTYFLIRFESSSALYIGNASTNFCVTSQLFRDPSAWYHLVIVLDTTQATATDRLKIYVNGVQVTSFSSDNRAAQIALNSDQGINQASVHNIGQEGTGVFYLDGYLAEVNFIDGQALTPSSFGETSTTTGVWKPKAYTGTYGTNGFYLQFSNIALTSGSNTGLGKDFSGNGNYWNTNNISVTAGTTYDAMIDSPTLANATGTQPVGNYCVWNPLNSGATLSEANLTCTTSGWTDASGSIAMSSGKWYAEFTYNTASTTQALVGITLASFNGTGQSDTFRLAYQNIGEIDRDGVATPAALTGYPTYTAGDIIGIAVDVTSGIITFYKNNTQIYTFTTSVITANEWRFFARMNSRSYSANFGQRPFTYTPPSGYKSLCTTNLPDSTIVQGNKYMDATIWTGDGTSTRTITNAGSFKPDLVWWKNRTTAKWNQLFDSNRGADKALSSNATDAEDATGGYGGEGSVTAFNSNGFTLQGGVGDNENGSGIVGWQWQAGQGTNTSNTSGSITSTVSVNATAGFSIVTYTGIGSSPKTVGHGLGVAPKMIFLKNRGSAVNWYVWHTSLGATQVIEGLNTTGAASAQITFNNTLPTSSVISLGNNDSNLSGATYVLYVWAEIAGFSKFGSYTGNGSTDGPFIYLGFRPKFVMTKKTDTVSNWSIHDSSRATYNLTINELYADTSDAEYTGTNDSFDFLSNGFKARAAGTPTNASGGTYIYAAFAENPFKNALAR